jgi:hypothetical protein
VSDRIGSPRRLLPKALSRDRARARPGYLAGAERWPEQRRLRDPVPEHLVPVKPRRRKGSGFAER